MKRIKVIILCALFSGIFINKIESTIYCTVSGKVVDEETGKGIKGVRVAIFEGWKNPWKGITDEQGDFTINNVLPGKYGICFTPPAPYAGDNIDFITFNPELKIPGGILIFVAEKGKVVHILKKCNVGGSLEIRTFEKGTNIPIEGVVIFIKGIDISLQGYPYTDSKGIYRIDRTSSNICNITLQKNGFWWKYIENVIIQKKQTTRLDVAYDLSNLTKITGRVIDQQTGNPIKGVIIGIVRRDKYGWAESYSDENGQYSMLDMEPGTYELMVFGTDEKKGEIKISKTVTVNKDIPLQIDFLLDPSLRYEKKGN